MRSNFQEIDKERPVFTQNLPLIQIRQLSKHFSISGKKITALDAISIDVKEGDICGIIGQSGAGKSTLIRCLAALERPTEGQILIEGVDIVQMDAARLRSFRKKIGMIFQHFNLFASRTVAENISYPLEIHGIDKAQREKRVDELLELVGLESKKHAYPPQLSGGQKQRVGIARALACHPDVLLCDEATSALDPKTTKDILQLLKKLNRKLKLTIVLITHEMDVVKQICNKIVVLEKGAVVEKGSISQIFADPQHLSTKQFLQNTVHEIPDHFFKEESPKRKLLRLCFKGKKASEPIVSRLIRSFDVEVNILLGWLESLEGMLIGNLVVELEGKEENIRASLNFLDENSVHYEVLKP